MSAPKRTRPEPELFLDDHRGIYIPRDFAQCVVREQVSGVDPEDWAILETPDHDAYWDVWGSVVDRAVLTDTSGTVFRLYQDGALWLIPEGMEWSDSEDWFVWPDETAGVDE